MKNLSIFQKKSQLFCAFVSAIYWSLNCYNDSNNALQAKRKARNSCKYFSSVLLNQTCKQKPTFAAQITPQSIARKTPFRSRAMSCYSGGKPRGPVCRSTIGSEVAAPTVKRGFVMPKFLGLACPHALALMVTGGMGLSVRTPARLNPCFEHPVHLFRVEAPQVASMSRSGAKTMSASINAGHRAAPTPTTGTTDPIQLHMQAMNSLSICRALITATEPCYLFALNHLAAAQKAIEALSTIDLNSLEG